MALGKELQKRLASLFSDSAQSAPPEPDDAATDPELDALRQRVRELEAQLQASEARAVSVDKPAPLIVYEPEHVSFTYRSENTASTAPHPADSLSAPLTAGSAIIGEVQVEKPAQRDWTPDETELAQAVARQASLQIQNLRLLSAAERARAEAQAANRQFTHQNWAAFMDGIRNRERIGYVYDQAAVAPFSEAAPAAPDVQAPINVLDEQVGNLFLKARPDQPLTDDDQALISAVARQVAQQVENLRLLADASLARARAEEATRRLTRENWQAFTRQNAGTLGFAYDRVQVTPFEAAHDVQDVAFEQALQVRGETIGQLIVAGLPEVSPGARELANSIAEQASVHIENLRLFELNEKRARELGTVAAVSTAASTILNPDDLLKTVVDLTRERFGLYHAQIYLADPTWRTLLLAAGSGDIGQQLVTAGHTLEIDADQSIVARATRDKTPIIIRDVHAEAHYQPNALLPDTRAELAVPMIVGDKVIGVFDVQSAAIGYFSVEDAGTYTTLAVQVAIALQNARLYMEQSATMSQLRELDRLKSSFLANMSHELRTPLNSILGFSDVMLEELDGPLTDNMRNDLGLIQKNGQHLLHLINDVLDMAKIESGKMNLSLERVVVHEVLDEVNSITSPLASAKNLALFIEPGSDQEVEVVADRTRLRQVMINLVNNAIKFTEVGKISMCVAAHDERVLITVRDTGIGIPPDKLEAVFQEFTQVDTSSTRKVGGTGLGLPISRRLVEMHGGRLWAESAGIDGAGSAFYVELPLTAQLAQPAEKTKK